MAVACSVRCPQAFKKQGIIVRENRVLQCLFSNFEVETVIYVKRLVNEGQAEQGHQERQQQQFNPVLVAGSIHDIYSTINSEKYTAWFSSR